MNRLGGRFWIISLLCYAVALFSPAVVVFEDSKAWLGWECLWGGMSAWYWYANPLMVIAGLLAWRKKQISALLGVAACGLSLGMFGQILVNGYTLAETLRFGAYLWLASMLFGLCGSLTTLPRFQRAKVEDRPVRSPSQEPQRHTHEPFAEAHA